MIKAILPERGSDAHGQGHYGASRGSRTHNGVDYCCIPGAALVSPVAGRVTKLGYPYSDDLSYRYVEVTDDQQKQHRLFYVQPIVAMGQDIMPGDVLGHSQDLTTRYPGITPHCHYEIKHHGAFIDPNG